MRPAQTHLLDWYRQNHRALPWRENRDPYRIWISETMLQQTTTTAVIPYFARFCERFPTLESLASAPEGAVVAAWAGLGYYSRARNLRKSAISLVARGGFPKSFEELIKFPGFGPYTARSVASLAFDQAVGVVDGNVIRVLARVGTKDWEWWRPKIRDEIQNEADRWVSGTPPHEMNQALMELGRVICAPKSPRCLLCPLRPDCAAFRNDQVSKFPNVRPRRPREVWHWTAEIHIAGDEILIARNTTAPFLKNQWLLPARAERLLTKPKSFHYRHSVTHHDIFVSIHRVLVERGDPPPDHRWIKLGELQQHIPAALVTKALAHVPGTPAKMDDDSMSSP